MSTLRGPAQITAQLAHLQGTFCVPAQYSTIWRRLWLDLLQWQRSSNLSDSCFRSDFAFTFHRAHNPCFVTGGFSAEGAPFLLQRRPQQQYYGRGPSCWSPGTYHTDQTFRLRADDTALRGTLLVSAFGRISSPPYLLPKPHPSDVFDPRSASMFHPASLALHYLHISASCHTSPKIARQPVLFFCGSGLRHMHDTPRISILEPILRGTSDGDFAC